MFSYFYSITGFICSKKEVKQLVLINHNWISLVYKEDGGGWSPVSSQKKVGGGGVNFSPKKGEVGKIVEGGC